MAAAPPPPPAWPAGDDKPAAPAWDPDADRPASSVAVPVNSSAGGVTTPSGSLEAGYVPPVRHRGMCDDCTCDCDCDISGALSSVCDSGKWVCRGYIVFLLFLTMILSIIIVLVGIYASTYKGALAGVLVLSIIGPMVLAGLQGFTFCSSDFEDEAGMWCYMTASTYWLFVIIAFSVCHTIVVVTAPNSLRNYHILATGKTFTGSIRDPEAFTGNYRFFNFTDAMFFPGSYYAPAQQNTQPAPMNTYYDIYCAKNLLKSFCTTPVVPRDFSFAEPIRVWAGCSTPCGYPDTCQELTSGSTNDRYNCFQQWARTSYGDYIYGYKHLNYKADWRRVKDEIGMDTAADAIYIRLSDQQHVKDKQNRYKKYGVITEAVVFGIFFACCILTLVIIFACC